VGNSPTLPVPDPKKKGVTEKGGGRKLGRAAKKSKNTKRLKTIPKVFFLEKPSPTEPQEEEGAKVKKRKSDQLGGKRRAMENKG